MKRILLLGPEEPGEPSLERRHVDLCLVSPAAEFVAGAEHYDSVIVINDGGADAIRRVQLALGVHGHHRRVAVGVLTYLAAPTLGLDPEDAALADWLWSQLRIEMKEAALSLEYQAD